LHSGLHLTATVPLPPGLPGMFDHADVDGSTGRVFVAHTAFGTVEVIDGVTLETVGRIRECPEASGVVCAAAARLVFAAARAGGKVLVIDPDRMEVIREVMVGPRPNGLAWDGSRGHLLVADVDPKDQSVRIVSRSKEVIARTPLPGRPRWCAYEPEHDRYLVNIEDPAAVIVLSGDTAEKVATWNVAAKGPHGLELDPGGRRYFVACDGGEVVAIEPTGEEAGRTPISGAPDAIWFNPARHRLYVAIGTPGVIDVIDTTNLEVVQTITTEVGAHTSAFDALRQRLYVFLPNQCAAAVYEEL